MSQCRGITQKGQRCKRNGKYNGFCHDHCGPGQPIDDCDEYDEPSVHSAYAGVHSFLPAYRGPDGVSAQLQQRLLALQIEHGRVVGLYNSEKSLAGDLERNYSTVKRTCESLQQQAELFKQRIQALGSAAEQLRDQLQSKVDELAVARSQAVEARSVLSATLSRVRSQSWQGMTRSTLHL